jgi:hypothetical protein
LHFGDRVAFLNVFLYQTVGSIYKKSFKLGPYCRVSTGDNGVYTGSGLRGVIPYVQCAVAVFLSQVCS